MHKILFVCTGNICRSPTAEGVMQKLVKEAGVEKDFVIDSAGTSSYHSGDAPDIRSIYCAAKHGVDITCLRSRPLRAEDFANFDIIFAMDEQNIYNIENKRPYSKEYERARVCKLLEYAPELGENIPDPYYGNDGFEIVFNMIEQSCKNLLNILLNNKN